MSDAQTATSDNSATADTGAATQTQQATTQQTAKTAENTTVTAQTGDATGKTAAAETAKPSWREDWRQALAGEDDKAIKRLERFGGPEDIWKSFRNLEARMSSGELKQNIPFPDKGTPEEQTAWRKENGVPADYTGYWGSMKFDNGLVIGDDDKPLVNAFLKDVAHANNWTADRTKQAIAWHYATREKQQAEIVERDNTQRTEAEEALRQSWPGGDYQTNLTALTAFIGRLPEGVRDVFKNSRGADGRALLNNPDIVKALVAFERDINPMATVMPNSSNPMQAMASEKADIQAKMKDAHSEYHKGPIVDAQTGETKLQKRYREIIEAEQRMASRGKAA